MPKDSQSSGAIAHPGDREWFRRIAEKAREVLRERGFREEQIDGELQRRSRDDLSRS